MISDGIVGRFRNHEFDEHIRAQLLEAIDAAPPTGTVRFRYNIHNVLLNFDELSVTLEDVLDPITECRMRMDDFQVWLREAVPGRSRPPRTSDEH